MARLHGTDTLAFMWTAIRGALGDSGAARPPGPSPSDRWVVLGFAAVIVVEAIVREGLALRAGHVAVGFAVLFAVWLRRPSPFLATALGFGLVNAWSVVLRALGLPEATLHANAVVLVLPYSLLRWGSAREVLAGLAILVATYATAALRGEMRGAGDAIGAAVVMLFPGALGASVRFRAQSHARQIEHVKLRERAELARDLHDTVAHHVAAIAIQAQAGRAVLATRPDRTASTLEAIEKEAARTLASLRSMVGSLRDHREGHAPSAPQPGLADLVDLARPASPAREGGEGGALVVHVEIEGGLDPAAIAPAVQTALFRIAQESITNAVRHARGASRARVRVTSRVEGVHMTVEDDGTSASTSRRGSGFGLVGMAERAALLGGRLEAGPREEGGWKVEVDLPWSESSR